MANPTEGESTPQSKNKKYYMNIGLLKFGNNTNKPKFYSGRNSEQIEVREYLLSFGAESLSSSLLSKNLKIKIYRTIILLVVLYGCETWSLIEGGT